MDRGSDCLGTINARYRSGPCEEPSGALQLCLARFDVAFLRHPRDLDMTLRRGIAVAGGQLSLRLGDGLARSAAPTSAKPNVPGLQGLLVGASPIGWIVGPYLLFKLLRQIRIARRTKPSSRRAHRSRLALSMLPTAVRALVPSRGFSNSSVTGDWRPPHSESATKYSRCLLCGAETLCAPNTTDPTA